jgi:RNA polymerase sigma-70 factor, ECF subfamily
LQGCLVHTTPQSLLQRLVALHAPEDWQRFAALYTPLLFYWAAKLHVPRDDAGDAVQEALAAAWRDLPQYQRRPGCRFRAWLWTVMRHRVAMSRRKSPLPTAHGMDKLDDLVDERASDDLADDEYRRYLTQRCVELMEDRFEPRTWRAFWMLVVEGQSPAAVAAALGGSVNSVYLAKSKVLRHLRRELAGMMD